MSPPHARTAILGFGWLLTATQARALDAQPRAGDAAITDAGRGSETYVRLAGMVGGAAGFHRLEAQLLRRGYRVVAVERMAGVGHFPHEESPAEVARYLVAPLAASTAPRPAAERRLGAAP